MVCSFFVIGDGALNDRAQYGEREQAVSVNLSARRHRHVAIVKLEKPAGLLLPAGIALAYASKDLSHNFLAGE